MFKRSSRLPEAGRRHIDLSAGTPAPLYLTPEQTAELERRRATAERIRAAFAVLRAGVEEARRRKEMDRPRPTRSSGEMRKAILRWWVATFSCAMLIACGTEPTQANEQQQAAVEIQGAAFARDGDDIAFGVRLNGIDAPERGRVCRNLQGADVNVWREARRVLSDLVRDRQVTCSMVGHDEQGERLVGRCSVDGRDLGAAMVERGWARDWPRYSGQRYAAAQEQAREAGRGIWGLSCPPDVWSSRDYSPR